MWIKVIQNNMKGEGMVKKQVLQTNLLGVEVTIAVKGIEVGAIVKIEEGDYKDREGKVTKIEEGIISVTLDDGTVVSVEKGGIIRNVYTDSEGEIKYTVQVKETGKLIELYPSHFRIRALGDSV